MIEASKKPPLWQLRPLRNPDLPPTLEIPADGITIGRDPGSTVAVNGLQFPHVSSFHVRLEIAADRLHIHDLKSKNGTLVNGKRVDTAVLKNGDMIQLGSLGPSFAVYRDESMNRTLPLHMDAAQAAQGDGHHDFGSTTIANMKRVLGIPEGDGGVGKLVETGERRQKTRLWVLLSLLGLFVGAAFFILHRFYEGQLEDLGAKNQRLSQDLDKAVLQASRSRVEQELEYEKLRKQLENERSELARKIAELESSEKGSKERVKELLAMLEATEREIALFDPINLERNQLEAVQKVRRSVVLVEVSFNYRDKATGELVFAEPIDDNKERLNLERVGNVYRPEPTGSGFCVSADGTIITNAHVVRPKSLDIQDRDIEAVNVVVQVVFTDQSRRIDAKIVNAIDQDEDDLALLKIEPFEGIPYYEGFSMDSPIPAPGSEVYLFGFPLGRQALHEGDKMIASTFRGILSRFVDPYIQVDAGVHPGNSGGPVVDAQGKVIGIVVGVQLTDKGEVATSIGYVIPVARVAAVWPGR